MPNLRNRFTEILKRLPLHTDTDRFLLAVSGGPDSMAMALLFKGRGLKFGIAHCNFELRGEESDREETFVKEWAQKQQIPFFSKHFDTRRLAAQKDISIQMAARELRYAWFEDLRVQENFDWIVTAHHLDDQAETVLMNMLRGTGISGLRGIKMVSGHLLRPLLSFRRDEIMQYLADHNAKWMNDSSNQHTDYLRNRLRLEVLPLLDQIYPGWMENFQRNNQRLILADKIYSDYISTEKASRVTVKANGMRIATDGLSDSDETSVLLYELLKEKGFSYTQACDMARCIPGIPGKQFLSASHRAVLERGYFGITEIATPCNDVYTIEAATCSIEFPIRLRFDLLDALPEGPYAQAGTLVWFDAENLAYPLTLRHPLPGDRFRPFGMKGSQKISDLLTQRKLSTIEKENIWLLCSANEILWVAGIRAGEACRPSASAKRILQIQWLGASDSGLPAESRP